MLRFKRCLSAMLITSGVIFPYFANARPNTVQKDKVMSATQNEQWATHCIGRFLVDLPLDAEIIGARYEYAFATVEQQPMDRDAFRKEVNALESRLTNEQHKSGTALLLQKMVPNDDTRVFGYWGNEVRSSVVEISGYRWIDGIRYVIHKRASRDKLENAIAKMSETLAILRTRGSDTPSAPGFCIKHAFFADSGRSDNESLNTRYRLKGHPDIVIDLATKINAGAPPESLLSRKPSVFSALGILGATLGGVQNLKEGDRPIRDYPGQEWLLKAPNDHGQSAHLFTWEAPGVHANAFRPQIRVDLQSGNFDGGLDPRPISMTDKQMLELWDKILNSLRLRPTDDGDGAGGKPSPQSNNGNDLPLGELVRTGAICPQTGYWQCPENDVHGNTRLFKAGDAMPPAIIRRDLSFVERLKGSSDQHSSSTVWRLVRYDDASSTNSPTSLAVDDTTQLSSEA